MASEWKTMKLGEFLNLKRGYDLPSQNRRAGAHPIVSSSGISGFHSEAKVHGPGVVTGRYGTIGIVHYIENDFWPLNTTLYVQDFKGNHRRFAKYLLESVDFHQFSDKAAVPGINRNHVHEAVVIVPLLVEQERIADTIGSLELRIDLLSKSNATLEAIAQALFKSWFVDFDPVRAKVEGREPEGMDATTAALFPSEFEESELGLIPKGWSSPAVYDLAQFINGAAYKAFDPNREKRGLPIIKIVELKAGVTEQTAYSDVQMPYKYRIDQGDILFSWSGNPDTSIDTFVWSSGSAWLNQHIFRVIPNCSSERSFALLALKYLRPVFAEIARDKQTTGLGHVTVSDLKRLRITKPEQAVLERWSLLVDPLVKKAFSVQQQAQTLAELRDTLLPRLISGKLRLPDAAAITEDAIA
jgi:type I restriction enzyme S subunit